MRLAFAGTPWFAAQILSILFESKHEVGLVISQPDSRRGRGLRTSLTPVAKLAEENELPLSQPARIGEISEEISHYDALVVAAYGQILRVDTLTAPPCGAYNVHASLLPAYRGAAPIERALMAGEKKTGVSIMRMDEGLDTGPVILRREIPVSTDTSAGELTDDLAIVGGEAMVVALNQIEDGIAEFQEQDASLATYAAKISAGDRRISWNSTAEEIKNLIRALSPHIGAHAIHPNFDGPIKVLRSRVIRGYERPLDIGQISSDQGRIVVGCGTGMLELEELQAPGKKPLHVQDFLRGNPLGGTFTH